MGIILALDLGKFKTVAVGMTAAAGRRVFGPR
jgi:hypothetical protein